MTACRSHSASPHLRRPNFPLVSETGRWRGCRQRRPRCRSGHMHKTGTEPGHMTGTNFGAIWGVYCRPEAFQSFAAVRWTSSCRLCVLAGYSLCWWREWCCGGLPPPGKGPSPAVWGEGLSRLSLFASLIMPLGYAVECRQTGREIAMSVCAAASGVVCAPAPAALPAASKAQRCRPSLRPKAPSLRRLLRPLLLWLDRLCLVEIKEEALARENLCAAARLHDAALVGPGVLSVSGSCGRTPRMPAGAGLGVDPGTWTEPGLNLGTWPEPVPAPSNVSTVGHKCVGFSQLGGGRGPAGSV